MIQFHGKVFDDYVPSGVAVYTGVQHMKTLAAGDQIGLMVVADQLVAAGITITVAIEHSTDGRNWTQKAAAPEVQAALGTVRKALYGGETRFSPLFSLAFVRLRVQLQATFTPAAHVQVFATVRDQAGSPGDCACDGPKALPSLAVQTELATLSAHTPTEAVEHLHAELAHHEGPVTAERLHAALSRLPEESRAELTAHAERVGSLSPESRRVFLRALLDNDQE